MRTLSSQEIWQQAFGGKTVGLIKSEAIARRIAADIKRKVSEVFVQVSEDIFHPGTYTVHVTVTRMEMHPGPDHATQRVHNAASRAIRASVRRSDLVEQWPLPK